MRAEHDADELPGTPEAVEQLQRRSGSRQAATLILIEQDQPAAEPDQDEVEQAQGHR